MKYKPQPKGTKFFYTPERFYDAAQKLNDRFEERDIDYTMLWSECDRNKNCRSLTIEVGIDDFEKLIDCMDMYFPGEAWSMDVIDYGVILYFNF